jgi:hypothetical protein
LSAYTFTATATDSDLPAQALTFSLVGAPTGASINSSTGAFSWTPTEAQGPGSYPFTVRVTDGVANTDAAITLTVTEVNAAPAIANVPASATIPELAAYTFTATATDSDVPAQTLTFSLVGAPTGASVNASTGAFSWTPTEAQGPGSYPFTVRVSDGTANTDAAISLAVTEVNAAPAIANVPASATIPESSAYTFTATATDSDVPAQTLTFSLVSAPAGAAIDASTGAFSWTPTEAQGPGTYPFTVRVTDGVVNTDAVITLTVTEVNVAPALSGVPASATIPGQVAYSFTATGTDGDLPAQTLTFSLVGPPSGAAIGSSSGVFTWTPSAAQSGSFAFSVRVSDGFTNTDAPITLTVVQVAPIADLVATQIKTGNDGDGTTKIRLDWSPTSAGTTVEVFRAGFGGYPQYDDAGGSVPATPSYPPGAGWTLTSVTTPGTTDEPGTRDFYYYVAFVHGPGSSVSTVSNRTTGTLDYFLGDVSNGTVAGSGNNTINNLDLSLLGAHYGISGAAVASFAYLDVGPTTDSSPNGRPTTDKAVNFEDLVMFGLLYQQVSEPAGIPAAGVVPITSSSLALESGSRAVVGDTIRCAIGLRDAGEVQAVSIALVFDPAKVRPVGVIAGSLLAGDRGLVLSPQPGVVDATFLGVAGSSAEGVVATVEFVAIAPGDPGIGVGKVDARNTLNHRITLPVEVHTPSIVVPNVTAFAPAGPNPFRGSTTFALDLAEVARVGLELFSVDGRRVRSLVDKVYEPGRYTLAWDGHDDGGRAVAPGVYYVRFVAGAKRFTHSVVLLR